MGHQVENSCFGSWREAGIRLYGMHWSRQAPADHEFLVLPHHRTLELAALALQSPDPQAWGAAMLLPERAWFVSQPVPAQEGMWLAARDWVS